MKMYNERDAVIEKINLLQVKQAEELVVLKEQFQVTYDSLKPMNFIKSTFHDVATSKEIQGDLVNGALNLATGLISKKLLVGFIEKPMKKLVTTGIQFLLSKITPKKE